MNTPIGIPSGWEEIAAMLLHWSPDDWKSDTFTRSRASWYIKHAHDWRVVE